MCAYINTTYYSFPIKDYEHLFNVPCTAPELINDAPVILAISYIPAAG